MKRRTYIVLIIIVSCNFLNAQKIKKEESLIKSTDPLEFRPSLNYDISFDVDSTTSEETNNILKQIQPLVEKEENREALNLINLIDEKDLEKGGLLLLKGLLEFNLEDFSNSSNSFSKFIPLTTNDSIKSCVYYTMGVIDLQRDLKISASHNFEKALELDNNNFNAAIVLGQNSYYNNGLHKTLFYYEKAVKINPKLNNVWNNLGFLYQQKGEYLKAKNIFSKIIIDEPNSPLPYSNRSYSNLKLGLTKQAMEDINKSIKIFPENSYAFRNRALIYISLKEIKKACMDIETAIKLGYREKYGSDLDLIQSQNCKFEPD